MRTDIFYYAGLVRSVHLLVTINKVRVYIINEYRQQVIYIRYLEFYPPKLNPEHPTRLKCFWVRNVLLWEFTSFQPRFTRKSRFICSDIHLQTRCKVWETFSWSKPDLSYSVFTPQGRTSQLIPVTRKLQQPPLWQTGPPHISHGSNYSGFIFPWSCLILLMSLRELKNLRFKNAFGRSSLKVHILPLSRCKHAQETKSFS